MIYLGKQIDANVGRKKQNNCVNMFALPYICIWGGGGMSDTRWKEALHLCMLYGFFSRIPLRDKGFSNLYPLVREPHGDALKR